MKGSLMKLSFKQIIELAKWWKINMQSDRIDLAALEPMLWQDKAVSISCLVKELKQLGFIVTMTSNGSKLKKFAGDLSKAGLDLLRISWHSMDNEVYKKITGTGILNDLLTGLNTAIDSGLKLSLNRVLLKGYLDDLQNQVEYIDKNRLRLKLLDLYWTPDTADQYRQFYISPREALKHVGPKFLRNQNSTNLKTHQRARIRFETPNHGIIEYKLSKSARKNSDPCENCPKRSNCLEGYGDYLRIFPNGYGALCYLRTDLTFPVINHDNKICLADNPSLLSKLKNEFANIPLRIIMIGICNYSCGFPGSKESWCLKQGRGFIFPKRPDAFPNNIEEVLPN